MSKRKNNITYVKPHDPKFLAQLKAQIGYKEGYTIDEKRAKISENRDSGEDYPEGDRPDEKPQIVVVKKGDLTADQVALEEQRIEREKAAQKADLTQPIVFKQRSKAGKDPLDKNEQQKTTAATEKTQANKLSFAYDDDDEDDEQEDNDE